MNPQLPFSDHFLGGGKQNIGNIAIEAPVSGDLVQIGHGNQVLFQLRVLGVRDATLRLNPQDPLLQMLMQMVTEGKAQSNQLAAGGIKPEIVPPARRAEDFLPDAPFAPPLGVPISLAGDTSQLIGGLASFNELLQQLDQRFSGTLASLSDRKQNINLSDVLLQKGNLALWRFRQGALCLFAEQTSLYLLAEPQDSAQPMLGAFQMAARTNLEVLRGWVMFQKYRLSAPTLIDPQAFAALSQGHWQVVLNNWSTEQCLSSEQVRAEQAYLNALGGHYDAQAVQIAAREAEWYFREALRRQPNQSAAMVNLGALLAESALLSYIETGTPERARLREARIFFQQAQVFLDQHADQEEGKVALAQCLLYEAISLPPEASLEMVQWAANQTQQLRTALGPSAPGSVRWDIAQRNLAWRDPSFVDWRKIEQARDILIGAGAMAILVTLAQQWLSTSSGIVEKIQAGPGHHLLTDHPSNGASSHARPSHSIHKDTELREAKSPGKIAKHGIHISRRALLTTGLTTAGLVTTGGLVVARVFVQKAKSSSSPTSVPPPLSTLPGASATQSDTPLYTYTGHSGGTNGVHSVAWTPHNSQRIASTGDDGTVQIWDATTGGNVVTYHGGGGQLAWSPDGQFIASSTYNNMQIWNVSDGTSISTYTVGGSPMAWSPDGQYIASVGANNTIQVQGATTGSNVYTYTGHSNTIRYIAWSPDSQRIASASDDKTVQVWDATTGGNVYTYTGYAGLSGSFGAFAVAWSLTGQNIASGGDDSVVQVWNATTGQRVYTYPGNASRLNAVSWSPDSQRIVSGDTNGTAQAWDATTGDHAYIYRVQPHGNWTNVAVNTVAWSPDGKLIASGCSDGTVEVWSAGQ